MIHSHESHQPNDDPHSSKPLRNFIQYKPAHFTLLQKKEKPPDSSFSENGLMQDIVTVTNGEPDVCLECFDALYHTLLPQIESQPDISFKDAWTKFIGCSTIKGSLCPPEKLIAGRARDVKRILAQPGGEDKVFQDLNQVIRSISHLKEKIKDSPTPILQKDEIIASLSLVQEFYRTYRNKVKKLAQTILEKEQTKVPHTSESNLLEDLLEPKAVMVSDIFAHHWAYRISRSQAQKLLSLDMHGHHLKSNPSDPSNHRVIALPEDTDEPLVFFKANGNPPIQPEKEFMLYSLYRHLQIPVPETALILLTDVFEANPDSFYAVQASEAVLGESPLKAYRDPQTAPDHEAYVSQTIGALMTNPSDGSFKNFKYSPKYQTFISIDNDLIFKPELSGKGDRQTVNVKSILYLFPQIDHPIPESIKTLFMTLDPHLTILSWLKDLAQKNWEYQLLFSRLAFQKTRCIYQNLLPQSETPSLKICLKKTVHIDLELQNDSFFPQILVSQVTLSHLTEKLQRIGKTLRNGGSISTQGLFEEISPVIGKYYRKLRREFSDIEEALDAVWGIKKNGVDYSYVFSLLDREELSNLWDIIGLDPTLQVPETFFKEEKDFLASCDSVLDRLVMRHQERRKRNVLDLRIALKELRLLIQEGLTNSRSIRDIVEFRHNISKIAENDYFHFNEIQTLFSNLPHPELKWLFTLEEYFLRPDCDALKDLVPTSFPVIGAFMKKRTFILTELDRQYLFGNMKKNVCLTCFPQKNPKFYLKPYPEWPGYEFASTLFMRLLGVRHLPYQDLIIVNSKYPVFITQNVNGQPVFRVWHDSQAFNNLDPVHIGLLIIAAMLLNPEDGKEDNFILSEDGKFLLPINYDHCFLPSTFQKEGGGFWTRAVISKLQMKTLLFCLDEMKKPIPLEVKKQILSIDFDSMLKLWVVELDKLDNKINNLVNQEQRKRFLEHNTVMRILFYKQFLHNLYWKAHKIQEILKAVPEATPFDLLNSVEPFVARCYQASFNQGHDLQSRFKAATNQLYKKTAVDGSRVSVLNVRTMIEIINISERDLLSETMFQRMGPLDSIELLDQLIKDRNGRAGREQEPLHEIADKNLDAAVKAFSENPKEGLVLKASKLMTKCRLRGLFTGAPRSGMKIRFLSLQDSPFLTYNKIRILAGECPNLEYLNVSGSCQLDQIFSANKEWPLLVRLEAKDCVKLKKLTSYSPIKILRIGTSQKIEAFVEKSTLDVFKVSNQANSFEFSFKKGEGFKVQAMSLTLTNDNFVLHLLQKKTGLDKYFRDLQITFGMYSIQSERDLGVFITVLNLQNSKIKARDIQAIITLKLINLTSLVLSGNELRGADCLEYLIQGNWPKLNHLDLSSNEINDDGLRTISFASWPLLETLDVTSTGITKEGFENFVRNTNWPNLKEIISDEHKQDFINSLFAEKKSRAIKLNGLSVTDHN